jgi:hypothetical protein
MGRTMTRSQETSDSVYSGLNAPDTKDIRDALGWLEPSDEEVIPKLIGAVMSLCNTVADQAEEIRRLKTRAEYTESR